MRKLRKDDPQFCKELRRLMDTLRESDSQFYRNLGG